MKKAICAILSLCIVVLLAGCGDGNIVSEATTNTSIPTTEEAAPATTANILDNIPEGKNSAALDYIVSGAKENAIYVKSKGYVEALNFIKDACDSYYQDDETLEKVIYYGYLVHYRLTNDTEPISLYAYKIASTAGDIYRGILTTDSDEFAAADNMIQKRYKEAFEE